MIVGVLAQGHGDGDTGVEATVVGPSHVIDGRRFHHEVGHRLWPLHADESQRVVTRVTTQEPHGDGRNFGHHVQTHGVAAVHAEHVPVNDQRVDHRGGADHDVPHAHITGHEAADQRGDDRLVVEDRPIEELDIDPTGIGPVGQAGDQPSVGFGRLGRDDLCSPGLEVATHGSKLVVVPHLEADGIDPGGLTLDDGQSVGALVNPEVPGIGIRTG